MKRLTLLLTAIAISTPLLANAEIAAVQNQAKPLVNTPTSLAPYKAKDYTYLIGMAGFSDYALNTHFTLYQGYVKNVNLLLDILKQYDSDGSEKTPQYQEIKRRLMWEFDGMRLHELYFNNLGGKNSTFDRNSPLYQQIVSDFGSYEAWKKDFVATGGLRGIGWVVLYHDPISGRLINAWVGEHDVGNMASGNPILIMDVWEHAYMLDYGIDRMGYIDAFFNNIDWKVVANRYPKEQKA